MELNDKIDEAIAGALGDAYDCMRVWNAWSYGTMSADDFIEVREQTDRVAEIREAVLAVLRTQEPVGEVTTVFMESGERDSYAINIDSRLNVGDKLYAAPVPPDVLDEIGALLGVGTAARTMEIIRANIENMKRRSDCLRAVEWEFFTVKKTYDEGDCEPGDEGTEYDECLLNWGSDPAEYVEQFRSALASIQPALVSVPDNVRRHIDWCELQSAGLVTRAYNDPPDISLNVKLGDALQWWLQLPDLLAAAPKPEGE